MINTKKHVLFLTGIKHSGKSSVGLEATRYIETHKQICFVDVDDLILDIMDPTYNSIRDFYKNEGKDAFMELEMKALRTYVQDVKESNLYIIALGGGACDNTQLVHLMHSTGIIIYISLLEETLLKRIVKSGVPPFLDKDNIKSSFHDLFIRRDEQYRKISDFVVSLADLESIESNAKRLASFITHLLGDTTWAEIPLEHH